MAEPQKTSTPLYYKYSSDYKKGEQGSEAVIVSNAAGLVEVGLDAENAKVIASNLLQNGNNRLVVIKDAKNNVQQVFGGFHAPRHVVNEGWKSSFAPDRLTLTDRIDPIEPRKTLHMNQRIELDNLRRNGSSLETHHVDQIQKAITDKKISQAAGICQDIQLAGTFDQNNFTKPELPKIKGALATPQKTLLGV